MKSLIKSILTFILLILLSGLSAVLSQTIKITGRLVNIESSEIISNVALTLNPGNLSASTNFRGEYAFSCTTGTKQMSVKVLGFKPVTIEFTAVSDTIIDIYIEVLPVELKEVTVTGEQIKNVRITQQGNIVVTAAAMKETPRIFSEPDLLKSLQILPGVVAGKEGSSDIYVRGGGAGQNIILANGCYFFLPSHFLGMLSPIDLDFLDNAQLYKDYFPAELGGGASSVISLQFKEPRSDSIHAQLRLGMLSSGFTVELPVKELKLNVTAGLKRGNYGVYAPLQKKFVPEEIWEFLPSDDYAFYDGYLNVKHSSEKLGKITYLFFGNYDRGNQENEISSKSADTVLFYLDRLTTGWNSMVHAFHWEPPSKKAIRWKFDLNYNRLSINREIFRQTEKRFAPVLLDVIKTSYSFSPTVNVIGSSLTVSGEYEKFGWSAGISDKIRIFSPNIISSNSSFTKETKHIFGETAKVFEPSVFLSSTYHISDKLLLDAGLRMSGVFTKDVSCVIPEPRVRLSYNPEGKISPHVNYVRLSQFDHSVEGTNAGLRSMLWLPVSKEFGPEISDVISAGLQGQIKKQFIWTLDAYYKRISGMLDYKSGASFVYDTTFVELLDVIEGKAYGLEAGIIKNSGKITGSFSYTYSRSKQQWGAPQGLIWIPSYADRPHNLSLALKYHLKTRTRFGLNWVFQSGSPATIYMHETSYGKFFNTKNNIRYFDYHRMDLSVRQVIYKKRFTISIDADIYNVYNHKNTFYFKEVYDWIENRYYFKNISIFPIMPSLTVLIKY